jgi:antitoxin HigA-1
MARIRTHPGEILEAEYLTPLKMSSTALAKKLGVPGNRISDLVRQRRGMTADTALRLSRYFRTTPDFWMNLQAAYDLSKAVAENDYSRIPQHA